MGSGASSTLATGVKEASLDELKDSAKGLSTEERSKILSAIGILEIAGTYHADASNGDWGDYSITVTIKSAAEASVKESDICFRDSPGEGTWYQGTCSVAGDLVTFTSSKMQKGPIPSDAPAEDKVETMKFKIVDGALAKLAADGTVAKIQGGYDGKPIDAILQKKA